MNFESWCPVCSYPYSLGNESRMFCPVCGGTGGVPCPSCICLDCGGAGIQSCPGCEGGRLACPACEGSGQTRRFLLKGKCSSCRGTGQVIHEPCDGSGTVPCAPCAGLGHQPGCPQCGSTGVEACYACFGSGLAPSASMLSHAAAGSFPVLLRQLPVVDEVSTGELLEHGVAVRRILAFLAAAHWSAPADSDESEHELDLLRNRLHLRAAFLVIGATSSITVDYRFLTIHRTAEEGYRVLFESHRKAWK